MEQSNETYLGGLDGLAVASGESNPITDLIRSERRMAETQRNEDVIGLFNPDAVRAEMKQKLADSLSLREEQRTYQPVDHRLGAIVEYLQQSLGVYDTSDVVKAFVKLSSLNGLGSPSNVDMLDKVYSFINTQHEMKKFKEEIERYGRNQVPTRPPGRY